MVFPLTFALAAPPTEPAYAFVTATELNLRAAPGSGAVVSKLPINAQVEIIEERKGFIQVRTAQSEIGWAPIRYLGEDPVTFADAMREAGRRDAERRVMWLERAHALVSDYIVEGDALRATNLYTTYGYAGVHEPVLLFDIDGDGALDVVQSGCNQLVATPEGVTLWAGEYTCCGC